jgi:hypothetical protein
VINDRLGGSIPWAGEKSDSKGEKALLDEAFALIMNRLRMRI